MNFDSPIAKASKRKKIGLWLASVVAIAFLASLLIAQPAPAPTEAIPTNILDRWMDVTAGEQHGELADWVNEGQLILEKIRELESIKDRALAEAPETLAEIESLRSRFIELLKMVERYQISVMSPG